MNTRSHKENNVNITILLLVLILVGLNIFLVFLLYQKPNKILSHQSKDIHVDEKKFLKNERLGSINSEVKIDDLSVQRIRHEIEDILRDSFYNKKNNEITNFSHFFEKRNNGITTEITNLGNGIPLKTEIVTGIGGSAADEFSLNDSYTATYQVKIRIPKPVINLSGLERGSSKISHILPGFSSLFRRGTVSPYFRIAYDQKISEIQEKANHLNQITPKFNLYECNTMLHLMSEKGRRVFYMQADMDSILKGSDGDRLSQMPTQLVNSIHYDPFTSYYWRVSGDFPNPMIAGWNRRISIGEREVEKIAVGDPKKNWMQKRISFLKQGVEHMRKNGFLISQHDPYICLPSFVLANTQDPYAPKIGDYALVIHQNKVYPCIVGDTGYGSSIGQVSARIATAIDPQWKNGVKVVSAPTVSYLIFPNTREQKFSPPDYVVWTKKCRELVGEIGGLGKGYVIHEWNNTLPKNPSLPTQ